jgi:hypothetical protein
VAMVIVMKNEGVVFQAKKLLKEVLMILLEIKQKRNRNYSKNIAYSLILILVNHLKAVIIHKIELILTNLEKQSKNKLTNLKLITPKLQIKLN